MTILEAIRIALQSLWANKLRSALTLLGVVIGVAAVIAVVTFVNGINGYVAEKIFNLGADVFIISKVTPVITNIDQFLEGQKRKDLTLEDYEAVLEACRHCTMVGASITNTSGHVKYGEQSLSDSWVRGMTPSMAPIFDLDLTSGRMLNRNDQNNRSNVVVIGTDIAGAEKPVNAFETLTLAPIDRRLIDLNMLSGDELSWLNDYHERVRHTVRPHVDEATKVWLDAATEPLSL